MQKRIKVLVNKDSNLEQKRVEVSFFNKKPTPRAKEDRSIILQESFSNLGRKRNETIPDLVRKKKKYHFESRTKEKRSYKVIKNSKSRAKKVGNITPKSHTKRREVSGSSETQNLVWKRVRVLIHEEFQTLCGRGKEYLLNYLKSRVKENSNYKVHQKILNLARKRGRMSGIIFIFMENLE